MSIFFDALGKEPTGLTVNNAEAFNDTQSDLLNYFSNCNNLKRNYTQIEIDLNKCWAENPLLTLRLIGYVRAITRTNKSNNLKVKGLGLKNEGRLSLKWLYLNHKDTFYKNLNLFVEYGSYQDLWHKDFTDWIVEKDYIVANYIAYSLLTNDLCRKYLPRYRSYSNITRNSYSIKTISFKHTRNKGLKLIVSCLNKLLNVNTFNIKKLMELKVKGNAHNWQQLISNSNYVDINFDSVPGKVLKWMTKETDKGSFLSRHNLEDKYINWLDKQTNLKNTSYIYELIKPAIETYSQYNKSLSKIQKFTIEKQLQTILNTAEVSNLNVMPVLDTSGSMGISVIEDTNISAIDICLSLGIYFSMLQKGSFKDHVIAFNDISKFIRLSGSYLDRLQSILKEKDFMGGTNFQSVVDLILKVRKNNPEINVEEYPEVYLVISDMQFNETNQNSYNVDCNNNTNHSVALSRLKEAGLKQPLFIWYNVSPYGNDNFQNHKNDNGIMMLSGFDPSIINKLMSADFQLDFELKNNKSLTEITAYETMIEVLNQKYLLSYEL